MRMILRKSVFVAAILCLLAGGAQAQQKIGVVDLRKVFESYYKKSQTDESFRKEAESMETERKNMVDTAKKLEDDWKRLVDSANDQAVSADQRAKAKQSAEDKYRDLTGQQQAIQDYDRVSLAKLQEEKRQRRDTLVGEIREHLNAQAKAGGYNIVFDSSGESANMVPVLLYVNGVNDLTDSLIKELNAGAPASFTPATNAASDGKSDK